MAEERKPIPSESVTKGILASGESAPLAESNDTWRGYADGHRRAARILWIAYCQRREEVSLTGLGESSRDMHGIFLGYLMLAGLSIENLIKAPAVQVDVSSVSASIRWPGGGHNSLLLLKMARLNLDKDEREILKFLSECVVWLARYPVPKKHESMSYDETCQYRPLPPLLRETMSSFHSMPFSKVYIQNSLACTRDEASA